MTRVAISVFFLCLMPLTSSSAESIWKKEQPAPFALESSFNSDIPIAGNDGSWWQGKGLNLKMQGGVAGGVSGLSFMLFPELDISQNLAYDMLNGPGDYWWGLDRVQRYSEEPVVNLGWGSTEIRYSWEFITVGVGGAPLILGAEQRNHIILSNNAGGFPHVDIGTPGVITTPWGGFEATMLWGGLFDSSLYATFMDIGSPSNWRFFHGIALGYSPPFWPELTLGASRVFQSPWETISLFKVFQSLGDTLWKGDRGVWSGQNGTEDDVDQLAAVYLSFKYPELGLTVYGELARNDHASGLRDYLVQPDHSIGYVFGIKKIIPFGERESWDFSYEQVDLGLNYGTVIRPTASWYRHSITPTGYTVGGQLLGAEIGPGSNGNYFELGFSWNDDRVYGSFERIGKDVDYWVLATTNPTSRTGYTILISSLGYSTQWESWGFSGSVSVVKEYNRYWVGYDDYFSWRSQFLVVWKG